ncbi:DNA-binding protein [Providencia sp. 2024EL-00732]|uniref:YobI family P-loop NTPase n=1 Tax=Providencia sp. 2024EL-00732 TaxID=3374242 RepID=UPI0037567348
MILISKLRGLWSKKEVSTTDGEQHEIYDTLTPKIVIDNSVKPYFDALDFAFTKHDVKNIAITGPYGAGKSTVILSYLKKQLKQNFINVSLADFSLSEKGNKGPLENAEIELSILQQILYKENKDNLPDSRIDRIQNRNKKHIFTLFRDALTVVAPLLLLAMTLFPKKLLSLFDISEATLATIINASSERLTISGVMGLISLFFIVRIASRAGIFDKKLKLSKLAFLQGSADMTTQESSSLLNNCLDEIVYFFSRTHYKIVVFEDLDRLGNTEVFVKLREINQIINNNLHNQPIRFIYACRDDIFLGADIRTKFFDFILPVIPVMDARNAYTHLKNKLKGFPADSLALLKQMSMYISDMRSLQNIVNEFNLFSQVVNDDKNHAKIFALIFYKNIYAQDYNLTDKKSGVLYAFIHDYRLRKLHENYFHSLDKKLEQLTDKLEKIKKESATSDADLRKQIICRFISPELWSIVSFVEKADTYYEQYHIYNAQSFYETESEFLAFFNKQEQRFVGYRLNNTVQRVSIETSSVVEEYYRRVKLTANDRAEEYQKTVKEIDEAKESVRTRNAISLSQLLKLIGWEQFKTIAEDYIKKCNDRTIIDVEQWETIHNGFRFGGFEALFYLLSNGYIMQDFMMFRSVFHEGTISINDNDYIKAVGRHMSCEEVNQNFLLDNPKDVLAELIEQQYQYRSGAIHHQIITALLDSRLGTNDHATLSAMIAMIFQQSPADILAIFSVLETRFVSANDFKRLITFSLSKNSYLDKMITVLDEQEPSHITTAIMTKMIAWVSPENSDNQENYQRFIIEQGFGLVSSLEDSELEAFLDNIKQLNVIYHDISLPITPNEQTALRFIADNQMYPLDKVNYRVVVAGLLDNPNVSCDSVDKQPWSLLAKYSLPSVKAYVDSNIDTFVQEIFISSHEDSVAIVSVLTHSALSDDLKVEILKKMSFTVTDLHKFPEHIDIDDEEFSYHDLFYHYDRVTPCWEALLAYIYEACHLDVLTQYIEKHAQSLSQQEMKTIEGDEYDLLYMKVICNDQLSDSGYASVLKPIYINVNHWDKRLSPANFQRLINNNKVPLNTESFQQAAQCFVLSSNKESIEPFVLWFSQFKETFFSNTDYYLLTGEEGAIVLEEMLIALHKSQHFTPSEKALLLFIYRERCSESFFETLSFTHEELIALIEKSTDDSFTINLIIKLIEKGYHERSEISRLVSKLGGNEFAKIFNQKSATLNLSNIQEAEQFLSALEQAELIKKWSLKEEGKYHVQCRY